MNLFFSAAFRFSDISKVLTSSNKEWFNVTRPLKTSDINQKIVLVYFWNQNCKDCTDYLLKIQDLERELGSKITAIGVYSSSSNNNKNLIKKIILKHDITHPFIWDDKLKISKNFKISNFPSAILFNHRGSKVKSYKNTKDFLNIEKDVKKIVSKYKFQINRDPLPIRLEKYNNIGNVLNFPSKLEVAKNFILNGKKSIALFVANSSQNNIIASSLSGEIIVKIGSGESAFKDGNFEDSAFKNPRGLLFKDDKLYVADTLNHSIRVIDFQKNTVSTLIGSGNKGEFVDKKIAIKNPKEFNLSLPTDIDFFPNNESLAINNSGTGQILIFNIKEKTISSIFNSKESKQDKNNDDLLQKISDIKSFDRKLYFIDSNSSSLGFLDEKGNVKILYKNNDPVNKNQQLSSMFIDDTGIYIVDSLNNKINKHDFSSGNFVSNIFSNNPERQNIIMDEPYGMVTIFDKFYVADSNNNRIVAIDRGSLKASVLDIIPPLKITKESLLQYLPNLEKESELSVKANSVLSLKIDVLDGWKINEKAPSFINLLEYEKENQVNLINNFDWRDVLKKEIKLPKLLSGKKYILQGVIYYCEDQPDAICYLRSYDRMIIPKDDESNEKILISLDENKI